MKTFSDNEIREKFNKLPPSFKEAIYSSDIAEIIVAMSGKYGITERRVSNVAGEIGYIILGLIKPEELPSRLSERLEIKPDDAALLAKDAYQTVLKPLAMELKRLYGFELSENVFNVKPAPVAPQTEPKKPPTLVIPPRPIEQKPPSPLRPPPPPPPRAPEPTVQSTPSLPTPLNPLNIPRQAPASPPPAPPPLLPPEQQEPRLPAIVNTPLTPMPPGPNAPRQAPIAPPPAPKPPAALTQKPQMLKNTVLPEMPLPSSKPPTSSEPQTPRNIFSPQMPGPLQSPHEPARPAPEKPVEPPQPRVFAPLQQKIPPIQDEKGNGIPKPKEDSRPFGRMVPGLAPKRPVSPRDIDDPYRETVTPQEKELQQKRDRVPNPRAPEPPFQVRKGEPPYVNPKIPPIDLRNDTPRPPTPPDPHWEKLT